MLRLFELGRGTLPSMHRCGPIGLNRTPASADELGSTIQLPSSGLPYSRRGWTAQLSLQHCGSIWLALRTCRDARTALEVLCHDSTL